MEKNVNVFLLLLVLLVAGALAGSSAYYQNTFKDINNKYDTTAENLSSCQADVQSYKFNLQKTTASLNTTSQDIRRYDELYTAKATELSSTKDVLNETSGQLKSTQVDLAEMSALKAKFKNDYEDQLEVNDDLRESNAVLTAEKAQIQSELINYKARLSSANACIDNFMSEYSGVLTPDMSDDVDSCQK